MLSIQDLRDRKKILANKSTPYEIMFKERLDQFINGQTAKNRRALVYQRQPLIGFYFPDFIFKGKLLVVEIDGEYHDFNQEHDRVRDNFYSKCGFSTLRIKNKDVKDFDFNQILKLPTFQINRFKSARATANSIKGNRLRRTPS